MRQRFGRYLRFAFARRPATQRMLPFWDRTHRLERAFKRAIAVVTALLVVGLLVALPRGRSLLWWSALEARWTITRALGGDPGRQEIEAAWRSKRLEAVAQTRSDAASAVAAARSPAFLRLLNLAGMAPQDALIRWGNFDHAFLLSSKVFEADETGRSYRLRANVRSVWLRQRVLPKPDTGLLLVPDTPEIRRAADAARATIIAGSEQATNSWGCRGPEPDLQAAVRGLVLGDSFMEGMLVDDANAPPAALERTLTVEMRRSVSILNTGVLGYAPEQYYATLLAFAERFRPHFVVVSVFSNDFGDEDHWDWREGRYWLSRIREHCRSKKILCVISPIVGHRQLTGIRTNRNYPGQVVEISESPTELYIDPIEEVLSEHLRRTVASGSPAIGGMPSSPLYNLNLGDGHYNRLGTALWGRVLGRRLAPLLKRREDHLR